MSFRFKPFAPLGLFVLLSACVDYQKVETPPQDLPLKASADTSRVNGHSEPILRTVVEKDGKKVEVLGAKCAIESAEFQGNFVTPSILRIPNLKNKPTPLNVVCTANGLKGQRRIDPTIMGTAVGGPSIAGLAAAVVTSAIVTSRDLWKFGENNFPIVIELKDPNAAPEED